MQKNKNPQKEKMLKNLDNIMSYFQGTSVDFFLPGKLKEIYRTCIENNYIYQSTSFGVFINFLKKQELFKYSITLEFPSKNYRRFFVKEPNVYELVLSISNKAYFSHYTSVYLHNLTNNIPKTIFVNLEKSEPVTRRPDQELEQGNINKAFYLPPRISKNLIIYDIYSINLLNGSYSNNLGVITKEIDGQKLRLTNIERTLIDITVSPYYCGGCYEVLNVYKKAKGKLQVKKLAEMLQQLNYVYPYHQCIGFFMEKAGYKEADLNIFEDFEIKYKFFVQRELREKDRKFSERWNLFYPEFL